MDYRIDVKNAEALAHLTGRLTFNDHAKVRVLIGEMIQNAAKLQVLSIAGLDFVDSSGLGMILVASDEVQKFGKSLVLRGAKGQVKRVLDVAQLGRILTIED